MPGIDDIRGLVRENRGLTISYFDASISSDGRAMLFASVRDDELVYHPIGINYYHADTQYLSDIIISLRDKNH